MVKYKNNLRVTGTIEELDLDIRTAKSGRNYIRGTIDIQTSESNVVTVHVFQMADRKNKKTDMMEDNPRFVDLAKLLDENQTPREEAYGTRISVFGSFEPNAFYNREGELVEAVQHSGSFFNFNRLGADEASFEATMLIERIQEEMDREGQPTGNIILHGSTFTFRNQAVPVRFTAEEGPPADYFLSLQDTEGLPVLTDVWGKLESTLLPPRTIESAFGEPQVIQSQKTRTRRIVTGANVETHEIEMEQEVLAEAKQAYEVYKAEQKEYYENRQKENAAPAATAFAAPQASPGTTPPKAGEFKF